MRRFGWDCHGLPIEHEIDKQLNMSAQQAVEELGVAGYNDQCRGDCAAAMFLNGATPSPASGRWVDFDQRLQNHGHLVHGVGVVGDEAALGEGAGVSG